MNKQRLSLAIEIGSFECDPASLKGNSDNSNKSISENAIKTISGLDEII